MTKERYFELCELMGNSPVESEIPVGIEDLPEEVRLAFAIWQHLPSDVDYFNGAYHGKHLHLYKHIFELFNVPKEDYLSYYNWIAIIDRVKTEQVQKKKTKAEQTPKASPQ